MVRVLLIQQLFNLRDEQMEFQLLDRLSFQRFVGLRASSQIPDRTTIWTFKERLIQAGASESVFDAVNRQLARHGYIARGGQMIDASIVQAPRQSLSKKETLDVGVEYPVHGRCRNPCCQGIERIMLTAPGSKSIRESEEICLVDRVKDFHDGTLDDLVLQRGYAQRSLLAVSL
jgi:IS5 family transposase